MTHENFYQVNGEWKGPVNNRQLISLAKMGIITADTLLEIGSKEILAKKVKQLVPFFEKAETDFDPPEVKKTSTEPPMPPIPLCEKETEQSAEFSSDPFSEIPVPPLYETETTTPRSDKPASSRPKQKKHFDNAAFRKDSSDTFSILRLFYVINKSIAMAIVDLMMLAVLLWVGVVFFGDFTELFWFYSHILPIGVFGKLNIALFGIAVIVLWIMTIGVINTYLKNLFSETDDAVKEVNIQTFFKIASLAAAFGILVIGIEIPMLIGLSKEDHLFRILFGFLCAVSNGLFFSLWAFSLRVCYQERPFFWKDLGVWMIGTTPVFAAVFGGLGAFSGFFLSYGLYCGSMIDVISTVLGGFVSICLYVIFFVLPIKLWYSLLRSFLWSHAAAADTREMLERWEEEREN